MLYKFHYSLNILVEGLLNSRPRVSLLLAEIAVFGPPRATRTVLLLMSPPPVFKLVNFNRNITILGPNFNGS